MYPATYNFMDEVDGTCGTDIDFLDTANHVGVDNSICIISDFVNHRKVLKITDATATDYTEYEHSIGSVKTDATIEFWWAVSQIASSDGAKFVCFEGATEICGLYITTTGLHTYNPGADNIKLAFIVADTYFHVKIILDDTANTFDCYIDGVNEGTFNYRNNSTTGIDKVRVGSGFDDIINVYLDAIGFSFDANYNIGDNCFWRHYKESEADTLEENDTGTQGTSITWIDTVNSADDHEIIPFFNEHKKILRTYRNSGTGNGQHNFSTQSKNGWCSFWINVSDITATNRIYLYEDAAFIIIFSITNSQFQIHTGGAHRQVTNSSAPVNDTWYLIYIQWYDAATDNFDLWIDNVQYEDGTNCSNNQTNGINKTTIRKDNAGATYIYIDAPISSLDSDERGDNRIFDYNDTYTREDCTDKILNCTYENKLFQWRKAILYSNTEYTKAEVFFQVHDINSKLAIEGEIKQAIWNGATWTIPLRDKNEDALKNRSSNTFAAAKIHDPTDSGSMLKTILPNISHSDGRLLLVNADTKTDTYSPVTKNYPDGLMLLDISDIGDSCVIIEASGKVHFDDDLASGSALDYDTAADRDYFTGDPITSNILEDYNYFEIFGAMNPDGARFYKVIDNTGSDEKHPFRITNNEFRTQTDVDAYAAKIAARTIDVRDINLPLQSMGVHDMGETFDYKYTNTEFIIPQANYYIVSEKMNMDMATSVLVLSEGLMEESKYAAVYERPENYNDSFAAEIYETDYVIINPHINNHGSDNSSGFYWESNAAAEGVGCNFYTEAEMDTTRDMTITITYQRNDANNDTVDCLKYLRYAACDGVDNAWTGVWVAAAELLPADANNDYNKVVLTVSNTDINAGSLYNFYFLLNEIRIFYWFSISVKYYIKRTL